MKQTDATGDHVVSLLVPAPRSAKQLAISSDGRGVKDVWVPSAAARAWAKQLGSVDVAGTACVTHAADVRCSLRGSACGSRATQLQSYRLGIDASGVTIDASTLAAARFARATLAQLLVAGDALGLAGLPPMVIDDEPLVAVRGVMLDISRCRVPTMQEMFTVIDDLARLKCNHLQLYIEHTFAYAGHEDVWRGWGALTPDELRAIDAHCSLRGIDLAANQNCFGHLQHWLNKDAYAHLAETHGDWVFAGAWPRSGPWSLCPTDSRSIAFVRDLLEQQTACVRSNLVNINCDETYDIAFGRSKDLVLKTSREGVYMQFIREVCLVARELGKRAMVWGDIALTHPACLKDWPSGAIALAWDYEPEAKFDAWSRVLHEAGIEAWLCPGTSSWRSFVGRTSERRANLDAALRAAREHDVAGLLMTDWGDCGHFQTWPIALRAIAAGLDGAWNPREVHNRSVIQTEQLAMSVQVFGQRACLQGEPSIAAWIDAAGDADEQLRRVALPLSRPGVQGVLRNQSAAFADLQIAWNDLRGMTETNSWEQALATMQRSQASVPRGVSPLVQDECEHAGACASFALQRAVTRRQTPSACEPRSQRLLLAQAEHLVRDHTRLWRIRSRTGGLSQSIDALLSTVIAELRAMKQMPLF